MRIIRIMRVVLLLQFKVEGVLVLLLSFFFRAAYLRAAYGDPGGCVVGRCRVRALGFKVDVRILFWGWGLERLRDENRGC